MLSPGCQASMLRLLVPLKHAVVIAIVIIDFQSALHLHTIPHAALQS